MNEFYEVLLTSNYELNEGTSEKPLPKGVIGEITFGTIQMGDRINGNGRIYPWETLSAKHRVFLESSVKAGTAAVRDGHPVPGVPGQDIPSKVSAKLVSFNINEEKAEITDAKFHIIDTQVGRDARAIARAGIPLGVSSRASGTLKEGTHEGRFGKVKGVIVQEDMTIRGYDFVTNPSVAKARSSHFREEMNPETNPGENTVEIKTLAELREKYPALLNEHKKVVIGEAQEALTEQLSKHEDEIRTELSEAFAPEKQKLEDKITALEGENSELKSQIESNGTQQLNEEQTEMVNQLNEQLEARDKQITELTESIEAIELGRDQEKARSFVIEETDGNPYAEQLRVAVLGPMTKENQEGIKCSDALTEQFKNVAPPNNIDEAKTRLTQAKTFIAALGVSTEKGQDNINESNENQPGSTGASRLKALSGIN